MNYNERYHENWENQCNFPEEINCNCNNKEERKEKIFYGYFVGTECNKSNNYSCKQKENICYENNDKKYYQETDENTCDKQTSNRRRCNCCLCNIFKNFHC